MSAACAVLPRIWATAENPGGGRDQVDPPPPARSLRPCRLLRLPAAVQGEPETTLAAPETPQPAIFRKYTESLLRRYMKATLAVGRVPSLLGRELFRGNVSSCRMSTFEDTLIFKHDIERCLGRLSAGQQHLLRRIALQEYTQGETAALLGISLRTVVRRYAGALDALSRLLLENGMLNANFAGERSASAGVSVENPVKPPRLEGSRQAAHSRGLRCRKALA